MPLFTWNPVPSFVARQINTLEDIDLWLAEMEEAGLFGPKDGWTFSDFSATVVGGDDTQFVLEYTATTEVDGPARQRIQVPFGHWGIANSLYAINLPWFEADEQFQIRFQPFNGLV